MKSVLFAITALLFLSSVPCRAQASGAFAEECASRVQAGKFNVQGDDPAWFFLSKELEQLATGKFWEKDWATVAANKSDPTSAVMDFHKALEGKGVKLILVPIPAKAAVYPDKLAARFSPGAAQSLQEYYDSLRKQGVDVLDIEPELLAERARTGGLGADKLYCEQDSHFSPLTAEIIAGLVKKKVEADTWYKGQAKVPLKRSARQTLSITGDQVKGLSPAPKNEVLTLTYAGKDAGGGKVEAVPADKNSPVLLIGDSHTLVFSDGASTGMHCKGAGLQDQLQYELGFAVDRVANKGSGLVQARRSLLTMRVRNESDFWDKKKLVIWVFSSREFTQSSDRLIKLPIELP